MATSNPKTAVQAVPEEVVEAVGKWLNSKAPQMGCPVCQQHDFSVVGIVVAPPMVGANIQVGSVVPLVQLLCKNCAFVLHFASMALGISPDKKGAKP